MEGVTNSELLTAAIVAAGFVAMVLLLVFAIRRARAVRQRQIDAAGEGRPVPMAKGGRPALRAEDVVPERADDLAEEELVAATPAPHVKEEPPTPPPAGPAVGQKAAELAKPLPAARPVVAVPPSPKLEPREAPRPQTRAQPPSPAKLTLTVEKPRPAEAPARRKTRDTAALAPGLARTRAGWVSRLGDLFVAKREIDPALVEEIEKVLLTADIGVRTSQKLLEEIRSSLTRRELADAGAVWDFLRQRCLDFFRAAAPAVD